MNVSSYFPPVVFTAPISNQRYVIADGIWIAVDSHIQYSDIVWNKLKFDHKEIIKKSVAKEYSVVGSKGNTYIVRFSDNKWSCSCPAFGFSGFTKTCKHIKQIKL